MAVQISRSSLQKLTHESTEIRLRSLEQIDTKFLRALAHNDTIDCKPVELCKQLIRWFGCQPLKEPKKVLNLLNELLRSQYGEVAFKKLGHERLKRELGKVSLLLKGNNNIKPLLDEILQQIHDNQRKQDVIDLVDLTETLSINSIDSSAAGDARTRKSSSAKSENSHISALLTDYEVAWSKPTAADYNAMKLLADMLVNTQVASEELENALQHLQITMVDYPAEYLLQAPHIYCNLLELFSRFDGQTGCRLEDIVDTLLTYLKLLKNRLNFRHTILAYAVANKEEEVQGKTQLKIEKALHLIMTNCLKQLEQNICDLTNDLLAMFELMYVIMELYKIQHLCIDAVHVEKIASMAEYLKQNCNNDDNLMLQRLKYLVMIDILLLTCENNTSRQPLLHEINHLKPLLCDYNLHMNFLQNFKRLKYIITTTNPSVVESYDKFEIYKNCFTTAVALLKAPQNFKSIELVEIGQAICCTLHILQSVKLTEILFDALVEGNAYYAGNDDLRENAINLLQHLLLLPCDILKAFVYNKVAIAIKKHFACLMNSEFYASGIANSMLLEKQIIGVPWSTELIIEIIYEGFANENEEIKQSGECILLLLLKSQHLLDKWWLQFVEILMPVLPLLQCYSHASKITERLLELFHPDAGNLPFPVVLRSNITFLFYKNHEIRSEALTRVIYMLQSLGCSGEYVPNILEIQDLLPNDLLLLETPKDMKYIFNISDNYTDVDTLNNLLAILQSFDIEPLIRKTTLMQLNVICQNWELLEIFCNDGAYYLVLQTLENALKKLSYTDYNDAVIPAVSIINKVLMFDANLRLELASTPNIYMLLIRALFLYSNDIQLRQDATLCLFQLIFATFLQINGTKGIVELPVVLKNLQIPLKCTFIGKDVNIESTRKYSFDEIFTTESTLTEYLRFHIASSYAGGYLKLKKNHLEKQQEMDIAGNLMLTTHDYAMIKCTMPLENFKRFLQAAVNATDHTALYNACIMLKTQLLLFSNVPDDLVAELYKVLSKYLHLPPGNDMDFMLYEELLMVCDLSIRLELRAIIQNLSMALQMDFQHAFLTMLKNSALPLRFYRRLCQTLNQLVLSQWSFKEISPSCSSPSIFFSNLFDLVFEIAINLFEIRDLQRVRCLLSLLQALSKRYLDMPDKLLSYYCKRFLHMSIALKSFTQTGAQWQRDCLQLVCQLYAQLSEPAETFQINPNVLRYLSALCCHNDAQVRSLSWTLLTNFAYATQDNNTGLFTLLSELAYLPGGFLACCLSTFLDTAEIIVVRQLAGNLFIMLNVQSNTFDEAHKLLVQHNFFRLSYEALNSATFDTMLPNHYDLMSREILTTSEIITCFCRIYVMLIQLQPTFVMELCEMPFMFKVYELIKLPTAFEDVNGYNMCSYICQLYAKCYADNFIFLQRTLCRDQVWLTRFVELLNAPSMTECTLTNVLQLLLAVCNDPIAYHQICELFAEQPLLLTQLFRRAFDVPHIDTALQRSTLALLSLLLIKAQSIEQSENQSGADFEVNNFIEIIEKPIVNLNTNSLPPGDSDKHKENLQESSNKSLKAATASLKSKKATNGIDLQKAQLQECAETIAGFCFIELYRLFQYLYTMQASKFKSTPNLAQQQVSETLSVLLKLSGQAQEAAGHLKLLDKIIKVLQTFFEDFKMSCTTFVRRYGDNKKQPIIKHFQLFAQLLLNWFSAPAAVISDEPQAFELSKLLIQIWPWLTHSAELKMNILQLCTYLSEHSLVVCQQFSTQIGNYSHSILQLVHKIVVHETSSVKAASTESCPVVIIGVRLLINCCACTDGRLTLVKCHVFDVFDGLYPFNLKSPKVKLDILHSWLQFWELFSRYTEGAGVRNLNSLCSVINRTPARSLTRLISLKILRNMSFLASNRSALMVSTDFIFTINEIIAQPIGSDDSGFEEQMHACVTIWKLISGGVKYISMLRGTKLFKRLRILHEHLSNLEEEDPSKINSLPYAADLSNVLDIIFSIFSSQ